MAADLAATPKTGICVSGVRRFVMSTILELRSPEGARLSTSTDFDETLHAPWEWDLKGWIQASCC